MSGLLSRLNDFLGLASLVALFLASVGATFLFRSYLQKNRTSIAILMSLGAQRYQTFIFYLLQVVVLGFLSSILAIVLSFIIVPGLGNLTKDLFPFDINYALTLKTILIAVTVAVGGSLLIVLPLLVGLRSIKISMLVRDERAKNKKSDPIYLLSFLPALGFFYGMALWLSQSLQVGSLFTGLFFLSCVLLAGLSIVIFFFLEKLSFTKNLSLRWAIRDLSRLKTTTMVTFVTIGLCSLLLNLIPQIQKTLAAELDRPEESKLPSLFLFDIQEEQVEPLQAILQDQGVDLDQISPTVRARLVEVNGEGFDKGKGVGKSLTREEEREMRFRNRGFNLSYRLDFSEAERLLEGTKFPGPFDEERDKIAQISMETRFADRLNFKLGDELTFEIEGVPVKGKIVNLRKVEWTSFQPNFFVIFQPGVLEMAPKIFIATIPSLNLERKHRLQDELVEQLPNVSMVDVSRIVERINEVILQMSWALGFMTLLSLISGFVVIYSMANHQARARIWEIGLLKAIGADFQVIRYQFMYQFLLICFFAMMLGALLSLLMSWIFSSYLFESLWIFAWKIPLASILAALFITKIVTGLAISRSLKQSTQSLFSR
jgi:putative ABC transport system permease protein